MGGNYTVKVTDSAGCESDPVTALLTVNPLPSATITPAPATEFCAGGNVVLSAPAGLSYVWNKDGVVITPSQTTGSFTASLAGNYTVTTTDSNFCSSTTNPAISVVVNPNPTVTVTATATQFCDGSNATLNATPAAGSAPFTFQWINSSGNIATAGTNTSYVASTTSNYSVKVTDSKGCFVTSVAQTISNRPNPDATITALTATTFCAGDSVVLQRGTGAPLNQTYQWIKDTVDIATASTNFNFTAIESGSYKVRVVDTTYPTNCTTTTSDPGAIVVTKTDLPVTTTITAH
jgi:oligosaccharide reducing-end xylanase